MAQVVVDRYALAEEVQFNGGEILDPKFDSYQLPRFSWLPKIDTVLVENPNCLRKGAGNLRSSRWVL